VEDNITLRLLKGNIICWFADGFDKF